MVFVQDVHVADARRSPWDFARLGLALAKIGPIGRIRVIAVARSLTHHEDDAGLGDVTKSIYVVHIKSKFRKLPRHIYP